MKDRPIIFSGPMVKAILAGVKTQTRRLIKDARGAMVPVDRDVIRGTCPNGKACWYAQWPHQHGHQRACEPSGHVGDRLWVRENFSVDDSLDLVAPSDLDQAVVVEYAADGLVTKPGRAFDRGKLRPSIYLPRWASRITLEVTEIRAQRLQEISAEDSIAEGVTCWICNGPVDGTSENDCGCFHSKAEARPSFEVLWDSINRKRAPWSSNAWVFAISFEVVK